MEKSNHADNAVMSARSLRNLIVKQKLFPPKFDFIECIALTQ